MRLLADFSCVATRQSKAGRAASSRFLRIDSFELTHVLRTADLGANQYHWSDGTAREGTVAVIHDQIFNKFFGVWLQIADAHPGLLMSAKNPKIRTFKGTGGPEQA